MSWAEVKKINSDMSTPINEFIENSLRLYNSTDIVLYSVLSGATATTEIQRTPSYIINKKGTITISCFGSAASNNYGHGVYLRIYKNGVDVNGFSWVGNAGAAYNSTETAVINVEKNDVLSFSWRKDQYVTASISNLYIGGFVGWGADIITEGTE